MNHLLNICNINGAEVEPVDIITAGFPCQSVSVAGKREGLTFENGDYTRSGLVYEAFRVIKEMQEATNNEYPKYLVFENVPGLLSSNKGKDFESILNKIAELGFLADMDILDAQDFGVPQRRKRVYVSCVNVEYLMKNGKMPLSESITLQLISELLLNGLGARLRELEIAPQGLGVAVPLRSTDSLKRTMNTFSLTRESRLKQLQSILEQITARSESEQGHSELIAGNDQTEKTCWTQEVMPLESLGTKEPPFMSTDMSLKECWGESLQQANECITLTATSEITQKQIYTYAKTLLNTLKYTIQYASLVLQTNPNCKNYYQWVESYLTEAREYINAVKKHNKKHKCVGWNDDAWDFDATLRETEILLERYFTIRRAAKIPPKSDRLHGNPAESGKAGQGATVDAVGGVDGSNGNGGQLAATLISSYGTKWNGNAGAYNGENFVLQKHSVDGSVGVECLNPWDCQSKRIYNPDGIYCTLPAMDCGGANNQAVILNAAGFCQGASPAAQTIGYQEEIAPTVKGAPSGTAQVPAVVLAQVQDGGETARTLVARYDSSPCADRGQNVVVYSFDSLSSNSMKSSNPFSGCRAVDVSKCIDTTYPDPSKNQGGVAVVQPVIALQANGIDRADTAGCNGCGWRENESYTLNTVDRHAVCYGIDQQGGKGGANFAENTMPPMCSDSHGTPHAVCYDARNHNVQDVSGTIQAKSNGGQSLNFINPVCYDARGNGDGETAAVFEPKSALEENWGESTAKNALRAGASKSSHAVVQKSKPPRRYIIRRLTPTECARLQGFPDTWGNLAPYDPADAEFWEQVRKTHAEINGKKYKPVKNLKAWYDKLHTDSAEYKAYGNGLALPCAEYVIHGIAEQGAKTLGSLFDGIGGFPLAGVLNGITPLWASEIEPYPIAVTKSRFKEAHNGRNV